MARTVKQPDVRRNEILDVAQQLFYTKGYEQASIRDIIDEIGIAKGTFYHHFDSKKALLDELIARLVEQSMGLAEAIVADEYLDALEKFQRFFSDIEGWKIERKPLLLGILRAFYDDRNAVFRDRLKSETIKRISPLLAQIVRQGVAEGVFSTEYPDEICEIILAIAGWLSEEAASMLLADGQGRCSSSDIELKVAVYRQAIEQLLGAPHGSLRIFDSLQQWFS